MWLQDTGVLIKLRDSELKAPNKIPLPKVKFNEPLTVFQLATAFIFAAFGLVLSVSLCLMELVMRRKIISGSIESKSGRVGPRAIIIQRQIVIERSNEQNLRGEKDKMEIRDIDRIEVADRKEMNTPLEDGEE